MTAEPRADQPQPALLLQFLATRPAFLGITLIGVLLGWAGALHDGLSLHPLNAVLTLLLALIAHAAGNVINDYHDARSGADAANRERLFPFTGGSRFIQNGVLSQQQTGLLGHGLLAAVIPAGLWLTLQSGSGLLLIGGAGLLLAWAYSAPPLRLMARGLGEAAITASWLLVVLGSDYVQRGAFAWTPVATGLPYGLMVAALLFINQFPDHQGDRDSGKCTLVVRLGPAVAKWGYLLLVLTAQAWLVVQVERQALPQKAAAAALVLVLSFNAARELIAHADEPAALRRPIILTIIAAHLYGLLLAGGLLWGH